MKNMYEVNILNGSDRDMVNPIDTYKTMVGLLSKDRFDQVVDACRDTIGDFPTMDANVRAISERLMSSDAGLFSSHDIEMNQTEIKLCLCVLIECVVEFDIDSAPLLVDETLDVVRSRFADIMLQSIVKATEDCIHNGETPNCYFRRNADVVWGLFDKLMASTGSRVVNNRLADNRSKLMKVIGKF